MPDAPDPDVADPDLSDPDLSDPAVTLAVSTPALGEQAAALRDATGGWAASVPPLVTQLIGAAGTLVPLASAAALQEWAQRWSARLAALGDRAATLDGGLTAAEGRYVVDDARLVR